VTAASLAQGRRAALGNVPGWAWWIGLVAGFLVLYALFAGDIVQPHTEDRALFLWLNDLRDWVRDNRENPVFVLLFIAPRTIIDVMVEGLSAALLGSGWPALIAIVGLAGYAAGGVRLAVLEVTGFLCLGLLGLWEPSVETLGAVLVALLWSVLIGVPLGILAGLNDRFNRLISPVLDVMQIMPTFAYLAPLVLFFGIGAAAAVVVTLIYAMPAAVRITALGIRGVPGASVEAGQSLGATGSQLLLKVRLPQAGRALGLGVNQALMLALSMIVVTALIDAPGLGQNVIKALIRIDVGAMFDAGLAIVILAIALDRLTERASRRLDPRDRVNRGTPISRRVVAGAIGLVVVLLVIGNVVPAAAEFPDAITVSFSKPIDAFVDWLRSDVAWFTTGIKDLVSYGVLNPLQTVFTHAPAWLVMALVAGIALLISGPRQAAIAVGCLVLVFVIGLWQHAMETLLQVLVATAITFAVGLVLGIASARNNRLAAGLRPVLDGAQVMPSFVYLVPAFVLFDPSRFTAIFAAMIFAVPVVIRLTEAGIRMVPESLVEVATASGATSWQVLVKVRLPSARPAIMLAANQAVILVLSMVVVGGLVGGGALGYDVVAGFSQARLFGMGLAAGIVLVLLGIMLDRMTQGAAGRRPVTSRS
jgi:glycine betaine/proline transport system permease protein